MGRMAQAALEIGADRVRAMYDPEELEQLDEFLTGRSVWGRGAPEN